MRLIFSILILGSFYFSKGQNYIDFKKQKVLLNTNTTDWYDIFLQHDFNGDKKLDFVGSEQSSQVIYLSDGDTYKKMILNPNARNLPIGIKDINVDGQQDVFVDSLLYYKRTGIESFENTKLNFGSLNEEFMVVEDIDGDGKTDILSTTDNFIEKDSLIIYFNDGGDVYGQVVVDDSEYYYGFAKVIDINNDGKQDVVVVIHNSYYGRVNFYVNNGDRTFTKSFIEVNKKVYSSFVDMADLDYDGDLDIVGIATNPYSHKVELYYLLNEGDFNLYYSYNLISELKITKITT